MRAEREARRSGGGIEPPRAAVLVPDDQREEGGGRECGDLRVGFGERGVLPEETAEAEAECRAHGNPARNGEAAHREEGQGTGRGAPERREEVDAVRQRADGQLRGHPARDHVDRIARVVGRAQCGADVLELRRVLRAAKTRQQREDVDGPQGQEDGEGQPPIGSGAEAAVRSAVVRHVAGHYGTGPRLRACGGRRETRIELTILPATVSEPACGRRFVSVDRELKPVPCARRPAAAVFIEGVHA